MKKLKRIAALYRCYSVGFMYLFSPVCGAVCCVKGPVFEACYTVFIPVLLYKLLDHLK